MNRLKLLPLVLLTLLASCQRGTQPAKIGIKAPDFTVQDSDRKVTLSDLHGKVVVLNFWATWCAPCIEEMPSLVELQKRLGDQVTILAVSTDVDESAYKKFIATRAQGLLTVRDPDGKSNALYGTFRFPETFVVDKNGVIQRKFIGAVNWTSPEIVDYLKKLSS